MYYRHQKQGVSVKERITYFDTYRFIAAMLIFLTHFIYRFSRVSFRYFHMMPFAIVMDGVNGKLGVSMLCVILGYFAYRKGKNSKDSLIVLSLKRYLYFVVMAVAYYLIAFGSGWRHLDCGFWHAVKVLGKASILLTDKYNGLFWTLIPMLIGSMICYVLGRACIKTDGLIVISCALLMMKDPWVFNCVLGCFAAVWQNDEIVKKAMSRWYLRLAAVVITFCPIRYPESFRVYILQGVFCVAVLVVTMNSDRLAKFMGAPVWSKFNRSYFSLYIFHSLLYHHLGDKLMYMEGSMPYKVRFILVFLLITLIVVVLSKPLDKVIGFVTKRIYRLLEKADKRASDFFQSKQKCCV